MKKLQIKIKIISVLAISFVVFATTLFALAENRNSNSLFLDSDQDGLTDQEEKMLGTDPHNPDTDGDGYLDGKEVASGYNPLKPAPGDKLDGTTQSPNQQNTKTNQSINNQINQQLDNLLSADTIADLSSDPNNPNLTNELIGQLLELTKNKAENSEGFAENPVYSPDELAQITQGALRTVDITKDLPIIDDSELNILPPIDSKNLSEEKVIAKQKTEIEKYLAQVAFIFASNSPFPVEHPQNLESQINAESANFFSAYLMGDKSKIDNYAARAKTGIDQLKKVAIPYILKEYHRSMLQLALYTISQKDAILPSATDPMKSLAAVSSLQAVAQKALEIQDGLLEILKKYEIETINFP